MKGKRKRMTFGPLWRTRVVAISFFWGRVQDLDSRIWMKEIEEVKVLRAHGGCLGTDGRRRAWQAAKSFG